MIRIVDLFAGIGGIRLGFEQAFGKKNVDCVFTSEIDKSAVETYKANFGDKNIFGDIRKIDAADIPDHDVLVAGFPCQSFSVIGLRKGINDERGILFFEIERILKTKKPRMFLLENVKGLKSIDKGKIFEMFIERLKNAGYKVFHEILAAKDFGVPQRRERVFIVGFSDQDVNFHFPEPPKTPTKVGDIMEENVDDQYTLTNQQLTACDSQRRFNMRTYIYNRNSPYANTLIAGYKSSYKSILLEQVEKNPRILTPRECARLQGFPDSFIIDRVSKHQIYRQFGNSVCVPVIKAIAEQMRNCSEKKADECFLVALYKNIFQKSRTFFSRMLNIQE
jgi:DNA (cytosine-5)-methyltransferase 1